MGQIVFDPLIPWAVIAGIGALFALFIGLALWRGLMGWALRGLAGLVVLAGLANPAWQQEERDGLTDIVVAVLDETASQGLSDRAALTAEAERILGAEIADLEGTELRVVRVADGAGDTGSAVITALTEALADVPMARFAGALLVTDGQVHDAEALPDLPAPVHVLTTGRAGDWDRRLIVRNAPAFAILGEPVMLTLRVEDQGAAPDAAETVTLNFAVDGGPSTAYRMPIGQDVDVPLTLEHGGQNVLQFSVDEAPGELTPRNNAAVVQINGVRDRLRVLLVSGEPHAGERTWRNLLKSDSSVDLVHFTILRPPEKQDGVPISELSLIRFPTRELFLEKIDEFDLIIFDRYKRRGILPAIYFESIRDYVETGGAVLIAAGPDFASADSLYRSPLGGIIPAAPTSRVVEQAFLPQLSDVGQRHPVTAGLQEGEVPEWGRWFRRVDVDPKAGHVVMTDGARPLLVLDRVGEGRMALLASDQAWLWGRGFEGGGPQLELLRRLAHWMMKEPELEEDALRLAAVGTEITVTRQMVEGTPGPVTVTGPDGSESALTLEEQGPGRFVGVTVGSDMGLYRMQEGVLEAVIAVGPAAPREFEETIATGSVLAPLAEATGGAILSLEAGVPDVRQIRAGRVASGRGWVGITPREAYLTTDIRLLGLLPAWLFLLLAAGLMIGGWLWEGRRGPGVRAETEA